MIFAGILLSALVVAVEPAATQSAPVQRALVHHWVSTTSAQAQTLFDEGLTLIYGFNREEAQKRFRAAAAADPKLAAAWWGVALAAGPNLNVEMSQDDWKTVREAMGKAQTLAGSGASTEERRLIEALAKRYPAAAKSPDDKAYREAMSAVHRDYPADDDVATLFVESSMDADDWGYNPDGTPIANTADLSATLSGVIARNPAHPGANHYFVHLHDFQSTAQQGLASANRLSAMPSEPAASHLKHMSGHIYFDLGMFAEEQRDNRAAVDSDRIYAKASGRNFEDLDYYFHNLDFYTGASLLLGDEVESARGGGFFAEANSPYTMIALNRRQRFEEALAAIPKPKPNASPFWLAGWHYARGIAFVSLGKGASADNELLTLEELARGLTGYRREFVDSDATMLAARIAYSHGDVLAATEKLRGLIASIAKLPPEAYPASFYPAGEWLGWMLLQSGDGPGAEAAFRADLARTPHNARALYGLMQSLSAQDHTAQGDIYAAEIPRVWRGSYGDLKVRM